MADKTEWGMSLQELLLNIAGNSSIHLSEMESDLLQINLLLKDAAGKLGNGVVEIGRDVQRQQQIIEKMIEAGNGSSFALEKLDGLGQSMDENVASVVRAMQFQDMTNQLLDKVLSRVAGFQDMVVEMEKLASELYDAENEGDVRMMIQATGEAMTRKRRELEGQYAHRVSQHHMGPGDIELF